MKRRYQAGIIMMLISAMIASNLPMTTVFAAAKKQQVKQETKKLEEQSRKMQQEIKDLDEKMIKSNDAYEACQEKPVVKPPSVPCSPPDSKSVPSPTSPRRHTTAFVLRSAVASEH